MSDWKRNYPYSYNALVLRVCKGSVPPPPIEVLNLIGFLLCNWLCHSCILANNVKVKREQAKNPPPFFSSSWDCLCVFVLRIAVVVVAWSAFAGVCSGEILWEGQLLIKSRVLRKILFFSKSALWKCIVRPVFFLLNSSLCAIGQAAAANLEM